MKKKTQQFFNSILIMSIKRGLLLAIPFLILGSFALLLSSFPLPSYQTFITSFGGGAVKNIFTLLYGITLNSLALVLIVTISYSYGSLHTQEDVFFYPIVAMLSYLGFCGGMTYIGEIFQPDWVFTAMCITLLSSAFYRRGMHSFVRFQKLHTAGADYVFNLAIQAILPIAIIVLSFTIAGGFLRSLVGDVNITNFGSILFLWIFHKVGKGIFGAVLYVFFVHLLWFFGIHGTNTLDMVAQQVLEPGIAINQQLLHQGFLPTEIFTKTFLDTFVFMGGCGAALCLVLALLSVSKKSSNRKLAKVASVSVLFNINEVVIFGYPVIFNPILLIPFICTPIILLLTSALAMSLHLVPLATNTVQWTVPIIMSGYQATGSIAGSLLQVFNVVLGTLLYIPFVKRYERKQSAEFAQAIRTMEEDMIKADQMGLSPDFLDDHYPSRFSAKTLAVDIKNAMLRDQIELYYQVQMDDAQQLHGAEALLRWKHPVAGNLFSPLMIRLAMEEGFLHELGLYILDKACRDAMRMDRYGTALAIAVNVSPQQLEQEHFVEDVKAILARYDFKHITLVLEVTERSLLNTSNRIIERIHELKALGLLMSVDDFGMGHSSMMYLQENAFDEVKLDGSLVRQIEDNKRSREIIQGVTHLANVMHFEVVAEFVETKKQAELLASLDCHIYQGYLYGKPMPPEQFIETFLKKK